MSWWGLKWWKRATTMLLLSSLAFPREKTIPVKVDRLNGGGGYRWAERGKSSYTKWWHASPHMGYHNIEVGKD
jgi:hypothetical protein